MKMLCITIALASIACQSGVGQSKFPQLIANCVDESSCKLIFEEAQKVALECSRSDLLGEGMNAASRGRVPNASEAFSMAEKAKEAINCQTAQTDLESSKSKYLSFKSKNYSVHSSSERVIDTANPYEPSAYENLNINCLRNLSNNLKLNNECFSLPESSYFKKELLEFCNSISSKEVAIMSYLAKDSAAKDYLNSCKEVFQTICKKTMAGSECKSIRVSTNCDNTKPIPSGFKLINEKGVVSLVAEEPETISSKDIDNYYTCHHSSSKE